MARYVNENTDDEVEYPEPNPRLEALPNWHRLDDPAREGETVCPACDKPYEGDDPCPGVHPMAGAIPAKPARSRKS